MSSNEAIVFVFLAVLLLLLVVFRCFFSDWLSNFPGSRQLFHTLRTYGKNEQLQALGSVTLPARKTEKSKLDDGPFSTAVYSRSRHFLLLLVVACYLVDVGVTVGVR